jgi:hypothetical protein
MPNCTRYHNDAARTGWFQGTKSGVPRASAWRKHLDVALGAAVRGAPLLLENWTIHGGQHNGETHDLLFVVTSNNLVNAYAIDRLQAGVANPLWSTQLPAASRRSGSNIPPPVGICSTPLIDETTGHMHIVALESASKLTSPETSPRAPALCMHNGNLYIAWKGDGNDHLNVAQVQTNGSTISGLVNKVILGDTSPMGPTLASLGGRLYIGWKGDGNDNLNVMYSADNGHTFGNKFTSSETSPQAPTLCAHNGNLYIGWKGDGNDNLNVAQVQISGASITGFTNKVTLGDTSPLSPSLASLNGRLYLAWKGDGNNNLNVMYSADNGHTFGNKNTSPETSSQAPGLGSHNGNLFITWQGVGNNQLNVALVGLSGNSITGIGSKVTLDDTSPLSPSLASLNGQLYIGWKGNGNDNLNVMGLPEYHVNVLNVNTGQVIQSVPLSDHGAAGRPEFNGMLQDQRGGLNLVQGWVYATFADFLAFDAGNYHGWLVAWQAANPTIQKFFPTTRTVFGGGAWGPGGPAAAPDGSLYVATGNGITNNAYWQSIDGGNRLGNKFTSPETSPQPPALCAHNGNLYIGWKGDGNDHLNVAQVQVSGDRVTGFTGKVILGDTSPKSPTLASLGGRLYIGWKGDGNDNLNVMYSSDNGHTFGNKFTSPETSPQAPGLCAHNGNLYITWKGDGNDHLNVAQVQISGASITGFTNKVVLGDTSPVSPSLASANGHLFLSWKGDGNDNLNVMYSSDNGHTFGNKFTSPEKSSQAPGVCSRNGSVYITWKGSGNDNLNAAQVLMSESSITGTDKVVLTDTSPVSPALASLNGRLYIAWKGDGNDNLNVMCLSSPGEIGDFMESVVRLRSDGPALAVADWYQPLNAKSLDDNDQDIGGSSPMVVPSINGLETVVVTGKDGNVYLLNGREMGHWGGALWREQVYNSESKCAPAYHRSPGRDNRVFVIGGGAPGLVAYKVVVNGGGASLHQIWQSGLSLGDIPGSPAVQSFPDWPDAVVWIIDDTIPALRGFNASSGTQVFNSHTRPTDALPAIAHFPPITCATTGVFVGTNNGFTYYGP